MGAQQAGRQGGAGSAHLPAVDADGNAVVWLVAANLTDELQNGVDGRGNIMVWPVLIVELVDSAGFLQEEKSADRRPN